MKKNKKIKNKLKNQNWNLNPCLSNPKAHELSPMLSEHSNNTGSTPAWTLYKEHLTCAY